MNRGPRVDLLVTRLGCEGIPLLAIARALNLSDVEVYRIIDRAADDGMIAARPPLDWPDDTTPATRRTVMAMLPRGDLDALQRRIEVEFFCTRGIARFIAIVLTVGIASRPVIQRNLSRKWTSHKNVDVHAKFARDLLRGHGLKLITVWGQGYALSEAGRAALRQRLAGRIANAA